MKPMHDWSGMEVATRLDLARLERLGPGRPTKLHKTESLRLALPVVSVDALNVLSSREGLFVREASAVRPSSLR